MHAAAGIERGRRQFGADARFVVDESASAAFFRPRLDPEQGVTGRSQRAVASRGGGDDVGVDRRWPSPVTASCHTRAVRSSMAAQRSWSRHAPLMNRNCLDRPSRSKPQLRTRRIDGALAGWMFASTRCRPSLRERRAPSPAATPRACSPCRHGSALRSSRAKRNGRTRR